MKFSNFAFLTVLASASAFEEDLVTLDFAATWNSAQRSPNKSTAQMCAMKSFREAHENMHDLHYVLEDAWVVPGRRKLRSSAEDAAMAFRGIVSASPDDDDSGCGFVACPADDDDPVAGEILQDIMDDMDLDHHKTPGDEPIPTNFPPSEQLGQHGGSKSAYLQTHVVSKLLLVFIVRSFFSHLYALIFSFSLRTQVQARRR